MGATVVDFDILKTAMLEDGAQFEAAGRDSYAAMRELARSLLTQGFSVVLDSPCRFQIILDGGLQVASETGACYRYIECVTEDIAEIRRRLHGRKPMRSQVVDVETPPVDIENDGGMDTMSGEERFREWMSQMKRPSHSYLRVDTSRPLAECFIDTFEFLKACDPEGDPK